MSAENWRDAPTPNTKPSPTEEQDDVRIYYGLSWNAWYALNDLARNALTAYMLHGCGAPDYVWRTY